MSAPARMHPLARVVLYFVGLLGLAAGFQLLLVAFAVFRAGGMGASFVPEMEKVADYAQNHQLELTLVLYVPLFAWTWLCRKKLDKAGMDTLGLTRSEWVPNLGRGMLAGALTITLLFAVLWITGGVRVDGLDPDIVQNGWGPFLLQFLGWLLAFAAVALMEELVFRGYLLQNISAGTLWPVGLWGQAILFALIHMPNVAGGGPSAMASAVQALPSLVLIAIFFALAASRTGSLWFPIGFHWAWNFLLGCVYSLPVSGIETPRLLKVAAVGPTWLAGGAFGAEASLMLPPILMALVGLMAIAPKNVAAEAAIEEIKRVPAEEPAMEEEDGLRENRFRTRFNQTDTFDADTLAQLREMQDRRRREVAAAARMEKSLEATGEGTAAFAPLDAEPRVITLEAPPEVENTAEPLPLPAAPAEPEVWTMPEPAMAEADVKSYPEPTPEPEPREPVASPKRDVLPVQTVAKVEKNPEPVADAKPEAKDSEKPAPRPGETPVKKKPAPRW